MSERTRGAPGFDGQRLAQDRRATGLTQEVLAERVRTTRSWLIGLEKGRRSPGPDLLVRLAEALGVDPLSLLATDGEPTLAQYRFAAGLTQQEIADRVGCSDVSYSSLERGVTTTLQIGEAVILAEIFGVDAEEVMSALGRHQRG